MESSKPIRGERCSQEYVGRIYQVTSLRLPVVEDEAQHSLLVAPAFGCIPVFAVDLAAVGVLRFVPIKGPRDQLVASNETSGALQVPPILLMSVLRGVPCAKPNVRVF